MEVKWGFNDLNYKNLLKHNEKLQWIERIEYDSNGKEGEHTSFEYDKQGNLTREIHSKSSYHFNYKFDKRGNWIERETVLIRQDANGREESINDWENTYRIVTYYSDKPTRPQKLPR